LLDEIRARQLGGGPSRDGVLETGGVAVAKKQRRRESETRKTNKQKKKKKIASLWLSWMEGRVTKGRRWWG